jgi:heat shock protein HtpX
MAAPSSFGRDTGLQARMLFTMFLLGLVYAVLVGALFASGASGVTIALIAGGLFLFQVFASEKLALRAMGAREVSPQEAPELHAMIERLCIQADLPKPRIAVAQNNMPNAFAMGIQKKNSVVCVTTGIMDVLSPAELEGVLAHELTHIANRDVAIMTMASFFASIASMIVQWGFFFTGGNNQDDEDGLGVMGLILVSVLVYVVSFMLMRALSRYREFAADRGAAVITGRPSALSSALLKIASQMQRIPAQDLRTQELAAFFIFPPKAKSAVGNLFSTHPPLEKRLAALSRLEGQLQGAPTRGAFSA